MCIYICIYIIQYIQYLHHPVSSSMACWKRPDLWMIFPFKIQNTFVGNSPLPSLFGCDEKLLSGFTIPARYVIINTKSSWNKHI